MTVGKTNSVPLSPLCLMQSISLTLDLLSDGNAAAQANSPSLLLCTGNMSSLLSLMHWNKI